MLLMDSRVLTRWEITSTQSSFVSLSSATRSSSLMPVVDLKMIEKAVSLSKFSISELENSKTLLNNRE